MDEYAEAIQRALKVSESTDLEGIIFESGGSLLKLWQFLNGAVFPGNRRSIISVFINEAYY